MLTLSINNYKNYKNIKTVLLAGKSGSGKTTTAEKLVQQMRFTKIITDTTRPMRPGEVNGVDYYFDTEDEFKRMISENKFAEYVDYDAAFGHVWYGSRTSEYTDRPNGNIAVAILNPFGVKTLLKKLDPQTTAVIYIDCPADLRAGRLYARGDDSREIERRLKTDETDFSDFAEISDIIIKPDRKSDPDTVVDCITKVLY